MKKTLQNTLLITLMGTTLVSQPVMASQAMAPANASPQAPMPGGKVDFNNIPPMNPEEIAKWEEDVTKEIDQYVATLSPEEQAQFHKEVEDLTNVMSKMNPDELVQFIDTMLTEEGQQPTLPMQPEKSIIPAQETVEEKVVEKTPEIPAKSAEAALTLIDDLIMHIERFLRKAHMIPELAGNIEQWVSKNTIKEWKNNLTWEVLKGDIESLNKQLNNLKSLDPKTKKHLYLSKLIEQETLYNNLIHIKQALARHEPNVEAPAFGLGTVTPKSHDAIKQVLGTLSEAIYTLHVPTDIAKVLGTSQAREKELKEEEDKRRKQAVEESKRPQVPGAKRETPVPAQGSSGGYYGSETSSPYGSSGNYPYSNSGYYPSDTYGNNKTGGKDGKGGATPGKDGKTPDATKKGEANKPAEVKLDDMGKTLITKIDKALEKFAEAYSSTPLQNIYAELNKGNAIDTKLQEGISKAQSAINNALDLTKTLKTRGRNNKSPSAAVTDALRDVTVPYRDTINGLVQQLNGLKATKGFTMPASVETLYNSLNNLNKEIGSVGGANAGVSSSGSKAPVVKPTTPTPTSMPTTPTAPVKKGGAKAKADADEKAKKPKDKLDDAIDKAKEALDNAKLKELPKHIIDATKSADKEIADAITEATKTVNLVTSKAKNIESSLKPMTAAEKKKIREEMREEYAPFVKQLAAQHKEFTDLNEQYKKNPGAVEFDKQYAFFGEKLTDDQIKKAHDHSPKFGAEVDALRAKFNNPTSIADLIKAIEEAHNTIKLITGNK